MSSLGSITHIEENELLQHFRTALSVQTGEKIAIRPTEFLKSHKIVSDLMERELKILEIDTAYVLQKIHEFNPHMTFHGIVEDTRYDFPPGHKTRVEETMRIRKKGDEYILTIKRKNVSKDIKARPEFEITPIDRKRFEELFLAMGLVPVHMKDKVRLSFDVKNATLDLDLYY